MPGKIDGRDIKETRSVATEACRQAANGEAFLDHVRRETGLALKTISATEEAQLTVSGCAPLLRTGHARAFMFDIGGGSTELMWIENKPGRPPRALDIISLPFGVVGLAEEFGEDPLPAHDMERIVERVDRTLVPFEKRHRIGADIEAGRVHMLGTSGTVTTLGAIYLDLPRYDRSRVDGLSIRLESAHAICAKLVGLDFEARPQPPLHRPRPRRPDGHGLRHPDRDLPPLAGGQPDRRRPRHPRWPAARHDGRRRRPPGVTMA